MAQQSTSSRARVVGDYIVGRQIGSGSFSTVWHARHRVYGKEVAIKEIVMDRLSKKLQDSLLSEIVILKKINHPNIIHLHDIIEVNFRPNPMTPHPLPNNQTRNQSYPPIQLQQKPNLLNMIGGPPPQQNSILLKQGINRFLRNNHTLNHQVSGTQFSYVVETNLSMYYAAGYTELKICLEVPGKIHLVLEYCRGGDLSVYIQRQGRVPEITAKYFMQQLAAGLLILRENNLIHRDLKPQNLLLSSNDDHSTLKIADFGFARSLQPRGLAETLCGSPLYMAPEIMQLQKYDAKADLWSVGTILFQLVTGNPPFTGSNQIQLLQNIMRFTELRFPPENKDLGYDCIDLCQKLLRRNPVERLTFEEFFNHPFLAQARSQESMGIRMTTRSQDSSLAESSRRYPEESSQDDCLPFLLDDDSSGPEGSPSIPTKKASTRSSYGFSVDKNADRKTGASITSANMDIGSRHSTMRHKAESTGYRLGQHGSLDINAIPIAALDQRSAKTSSRVVDSLEFIDQDYVLVSGSLEVSSSLVNASTVHHSSCKSESSQMASVDKTSKTSAVTAPMPILGAATNNTCGFGSLESHSSAPSATSQGSMDEHPSAHSSTRIRSLQKCASAITELVNEKIAAGRQLEAFSIQLVILAIWKQALHICHTRAASAMEGSPSQETTRLRGSTNKKYSPDMQECLNIDTQGPEAVCSQIEKEFLHEVGHAEELARGLEPGDESTAMPDAMETIFQCALGLGRRGAVDELMGDMESAASFYSKAVRLLVFLLVEAPSLILNPPFSLTNSDRYRLRTYIDILNNRQGQSRSQRMALFKCEDQQC